MTDQLFEWLNRELEAAYTLPSKYFLRPPPFWTLRSGRYSTSPGILRAIQTRFLIRASLSWSIFLSKASLLCAEWTAKCGPFTMYASTGATSWSPSDAVTSRTFVCAYHAWTYGLGGELRGAPRTERLEGFDKSKFGLRAVRLELFAGFIYINLDNDASAMAGLFPGADTFFLQLCPDIADMQLDSEEDMTVPVNWKVIVDNAIESYHVMLSGPCHKELADFLDFEKDLPICRGNWWTLGWPCQTRPEQHVWRADWGRALPNRDIYELVAVSRDMFVCCALH